MMNRQRYEDWKALCEWLEEQPYNAAYNPKCQGAYLLTNPRRMPGATHFGPTGETQTIMGHEVPLYGQVPNPHYNPEHNRRIRAIIKERRELGLVYWSRGFGWRLRKDYREKLAALEQTLTD
jgi:hypothetical protein